MIHSRLTIERLEEIPNERFVARIEGEVNFFNWRELETHLFPNGKPEPTHTWDDVVKEGFREIVLDVERLDLSDGTLVGLLVFLANEQRAQGGRLIVRNPQTWLRQELRFQRHDHVTVHRTRRSKNG